MYAVIETGGKQLKVTEGEEIEVERLEATEDGKVVFENVLLIADGENLSIGKPYIENAKVQAVMLGEVKGKKVIAFKMKRRKSTKVKKGHRQKYSKLRVERIIK
ncbi:MAG: 50S ribosomal protein L21 [Candidatus Aureabacteria bacterium]|nr:50S ribosomal protein L21 [Candidatus Auribacterota bacterium]